MSGTLSVSIHNGKVADIPVAIWKMYFLGLGRTSKGEL